MTYQPLNLNTAERVVEPALPVHLAVHLAALICAFLLMALLPQTSFAVTYTWTDSKGVVNYSERMPRGVPASRVTQVGDNSLAPSSNPTPPPVYTPPANRAETPPRGGEQEDLNEEQQQMLAELEAAEEARLQKVAEVRQDNCERATRVLNNLSNIGRVRVVGDDGSQSVLPEDERSEKIAQAQQGIAANC